MIENCEHAQQSLHVALTLGMCNVFNFMSIAVIYKRGQCSAHGPFKSKERSVFHNFQHFNRTYHSF